MLASEGVEAGEGVKGVEVVLNSCCCCRLGASSGTPGHGGHWDVLATTFTCHVALCCEMTINNFSSTNH